MIRLTVNAQDRECLLNLLATLGTKILDKETEGITGGCKWWIDSERLLEKEAKSGKED